MKNDWGENLVKITRAGSLQNYIFTNYSKDRLDKALRGGVSKFTERVDTIHDIFAHFKDEIERYMSPECIKEAYPDLHPDNDYYQEIIKIKQFNIAVGEIMNRLRERYATIITAHPKKTISQLISLDDSQIWENLTPAKVARHESLRALIEKKYPAKLIVGLALNSIAPKVSNVAADAVMAKFSREVLYVYPEPVDYNARVGRAILATVQEIYQENRVLLEKSPNKTLTQIKKIQEQARA